MPLMIKGTSQDQTTKQFNRLPSTVWHGATLPLFSSSPRKELFMQANEWLAKWLLLCSFKYSLWCLHCSYFQFYYSLSIIINVADKPFSQSWRATLQLWYAHKSHVCMYVCLYVCAFTYVWTNSVYINTKCWIFNLHLAFIKSTAPNH